MERPYRLRTEKMNLVVSISMNNFHIRYFTVTRMEEKDSETKKEYSKLHERYTELFKTHIDYMERTKSILGTERLEQLQQQGGLGAARPRIAGMALNQLTRFVDFSF